MGKNNPVPLITTFAVIFLMVAGMMAGKYMVEKGPQVNSQALGSGINVITNPGFESTADAIFSTTEAAGWVINKPEYGDLFIGSAGIPYLNLISPPNNGSVKAEQSLSLALTGQYYFGITVQPGLSSGRGISITVICGQTGGCGNLAENAIVPGSEISITTSAPDLYINKSVIFSVLTPGSYKIRMAVNDGSEAGFSNVTLYRVGDPAQTNLVGNNQFKIYNSAVLNRKVPDAWVLDAKYTETATDSALPYGPAALLYSSVRNYQPNIALQQSVNLAEAGLYEMSFDASAPIIINGGLEGHLVCNQTQCGQLQSMDMVPGSQILLSQSGWNNYRVQFDVPVSGNYIFRLEAKSGSKAYFDNVNLSRVSTSNTPTLTTTPGPTNTPAATPTPIMGDANGDCIVDGLDYIVWLTNYGKATTLGPKEGDFSGPGGVPDGMVNGMDYIAWVTNYGKTCSK